VPLGRVDRVQPPKFKERDQMTTEATIPHTLGAATIAEFEQGLSGRLIRPGDADYDDARAVWNGAHDRRPAMIVRCAGVADVMCAVDFARSEDLDVAVRGGGHSIPGFSTCDGGIVIDLSAMRAVKVDPVGRTAIAQGGCTWADFDHETQAFGLATTGGLVSSTGIAGFTLGGGIGWLMRKYGLACDNLIAADVVTADGQLVHASEDENPELLWGLRGGGGNFGVVTSLEFRLHPVGPMVLAGGIFFEGERAAEVLGFFREWVRDLPDEMTALANLTTAPPAPFLPEYIHGKPVVAVLGMYSGDPDAGRAIVQPLKDLGNPVADLIDTIPYVGMQSLIDALWAPGEHNYMAASYFDALDEGAIAAAIESHGTIPSARSEIHVQHYGGAVARVADDATAFGGRAAPYVLNVIARQAEAEGFEAAVDWARGATEAIAPGSRKAYVNFMSDAGDQRLRATYGDAKYERLVALKRRYDPTNVFRLNQNITP
jgi:FAD/FMN-containing dehydrogenase